MSAFEIFILIFICTALFTFVVFIFMYFRDSNTENTNGDSLPRGSLRSNKEGDEEREPMVDK